MSSIAPRVTVTALSGTAYFECCLTWGGWREMRSLADRAECTCDEKRVGLFTKEFTVRGNEAALNLFMQLVWKSDALGEQFRNEIRKAATKRGT